MLVAAGSIDACLEHEPCGVWDWVPVAVIVREAGGTVTTLDGGDLRPGCDLLSSNGRLHDAIRSLLRDPAALPPDRAPD
jgi:fructose-1,6-bisphosphatase/inositol monophosphatase family enzyme